MTITINNNIMKTTKRLGIWMDHSTARMMEFTVEDFKVHTLESQLDGLDNQDGLKHSESLLHNKENQTLKSFYKSLIETIKNFDEIVLFGPTTAKTELYNLIREDHKYDHLKIETKAANKMSYEEQHAFIKDYFSKLLNYESPFSK
jgi:stalled ribosome rescue protein Dom34